MLKFFRNLPADKAGIRQKLLEENTGGSYLKYAIGVILESEIGNNCPFRDLIWVEQSISQGTTVPLGTGYVGNPTIGTFHIAYLPTGQAGLRHAIFVFRSVFYLYFVPRNDRDLRPTGHSESKSSFKASNPQFLC